MPRVLYLLTGLLASTSCVHSLSTKAPDSSSDLQSAFERLRTHHEEHKLIRVAMFNSVCGPWFEQKENSPGLFFQTEGDDVDLRAEVVPKTWLVLDDSRSIPTWEFFGTAEGIVEVFRMSGKDANQSVCLQKFVKARENDVWYEIRDAAGLVGKPNCGSHFGKKTDHSYSFLTFAGDEGGWQSAMKSQTFTMIDDEEDFPIVEIFGLDRDLYHDGPKVVVVYISKKQYEKAKACLPPPK
jgi:hypothetical protein